MNASTTSLPGDVPASKIGDVAPSATIMKFRERQQSRLRQMRQVRMSWWMHWGEIAEYILPRRFRWLIQKNAWNLWNRGSQVNQRILNSTATLALRNCGSGLMAGTTSPARPWFRMTVPDADIADDVEVQQWCEEVTKRMMRVMAGSNYYAAKATQYVDLPCFGTAPMIIYEDDYDIIRCFNPCVGEYFCAVNKNNRVDTLGREFSMTVQQLVEEFGIDNVSEPIRTLYNLGGANLDSEREVAHLIEPNPNFSTSKKGLDDIGLPRHFRYRESYWEMESLGKPFLRIRGFMELPFSCPRWDIQGNDPYGRSPGMDALGDVKQLQLEELRKAQAIDKQVNPPMVADVSMKNEPASLLPGAVNYVSMINSSVGFRPAYQVAPAIGEMKEDIAKVEMRIKDCFFNDLFLMISQLETVRTATEIDARREEKLIMLGPVLERNEHEGLQPDINRIFQIMARRRLFPAPPAIMDGLPVKVEYIGLLADLQRASATTAIERLWQFAGNLGAARPQVLDNLDEDETIRVYAEYLRVPPQVLSSKQRRVSIRAAREKQNEQQQMMQQGTAAVQGAKVLSETDVGGGQNALSAMLNGGP
jgi:hypothetical protein